jgi:hypothetical protein
MRNRNKVTVLLIISESSNSFPFRGVLKKTMEEPKVNPLAENPDAMQTLKRCFQT